MRRRICPQHRRATIGHRHVEKWKCTRPGKSVSSVSGGYKAYIDNGICSSREQELLVLRQAESEYAAFVRLNNSATFIRV
jgi:hypothetical protein